MDKKILLIIFILVSFSISAQKSLKDKNHPEVGERCPNFVLSKVEHFKRKSVKLKDLAGKWTVLDCWNRYCSVCESSFPGTDSLQKKFDGKVQILLIGYSGSQYTPWWGPDEKAIRQQYEKARQVKGLSLPIAYDSTIFKLFDIGGCPFVIVIDPQGIIRAITNRVTEDNLNDFLSGKFLDLPRHITLTEEKEIMKNQKKR